MKKYGHICLLIFLLLLGGFSSVWAAPRVAVMNFDNLTPHGGWRLGSGAADILTTELVKVGKFDMFERERLNTVMKEQDFGATDRVDPASAARIGKIIGVKYIITGAITEYGQSKNGGGGGGVNIGKTGYHAAVDIRMIDAETGRIVFADTATHSKSSVKVKIFGIGGGESFNEKLATETMREAIKKVAAKINFSDSNQKSTGNSSTEKDNSAGKAVVADVDGDIITLNSGEKVGFKKGQTVTISRKGKVIKDPTTGKVLKIKYKAIGKIKLTEVESAYSEGTIIEGSGFKIGDIVR
jgi:curli biogenesis system outer membrane secretion channel CsgG